MMPLNVLNLSKVNLMEMSKNELTEKQKETCAIITMRDTIAALADEEHISYDEAMLKFVSSCVYDALFDFETGIWKESPIYVLELYKRYGTHKQKLG